MRQARLTPLSPRRNRVSKYTSLTVQKTDTDKADKKFLLQPLSAPPVAPPSPTSSSDSLSLASDSLLQYSARQVLKSNNISLSEVRYGRRAEGRSWQ